MPKTHVKKRIKTQNTRKNNKRGGVRPMKWIGRIASKAATTFDIKKFNGGIKLVLGNVDKELLFTKDEIVPNYTSWKYKSCNDVEILISLKEREIDSPLISCVEGIFNINGYIHDDKELILIKNDVPGNSSIFRSTSYTFQMKK